MTSGRDSQEKAFAANTLKTTGMVVLMYALAIALDQGAERLVELKLLHQSSLIYLSFQVVSKLIEVCETVVICAIVLRHTYDILRRLKT